MLVRSSWRSDAGRLARVIFRATLFALFPATLSRPAFSGTLYNFTGGSDGAGPNSGLVPDSQGNLFGTTTLGGDFGSGTVFKFGSSGQFTALHQFTGDLNGGAPTNGLALIRGKLYGGAFTNNPFVAPSVVYSMNPDGSAYTIVHQFTGPDGDYAIGALQPSRSGGEFGITDMGGTNDNGTLYSIGSQGQFEIVHQFVGKDGSQPSELLEDQAGNLFGSTFGGGPRQYGVIFEYVPVTDKFSVLYAFSNGDDGRQPMLGAIGPTGTLYGVARYGGAYGHGALFALTPQDGGWAFSVLSPVISEYEGDYAVIPPSLSSTGALVGATGTSTYEYFEGTYSADYNADTDPQGQLLSPRSQPNSILGGSFGGGNTCSVPGAPYGCGFLFRQSR
jgi:uncharacterized repeat protein (TIGR03803 family)